MRINKFIFAISVLVVGFIVACSEYEDIVEASPEVPAGCQGVYFPASNIQSYEMEPTEPTEITIIIAREVSSGAVEVPIIVQENKDNIFNVPEVVSFVDGEKEVSFTVSFPTAGEGVTYDLKLAVEGDEYVNPYASALPYMTTNVTRIKWSVVEEPMIYVDGAFAGGYGVSFYPMYVEAEKAEVTGLVRYRFKNAYDVPTGSDEDGIYDGYPYNDPGDFDVSKDYYTIIEIDNATGEVFMYAHEIGVDWGYGMISIGSVYGNISEDKSSYPLGILKDDVITFPGNSLYFSESGYNNGAPYPSSAPTYIYLTKEAFIAANLKIEDFNDVEYEVIAGEVGEFESAAFSDSWNQTIAKAIDIDPENEDSEYKDLYYLSDLYSDGKGVVFYYTEGGLVRIPENQPIGVEFMGKDIYVSQSEEIESGVEVNSKGVTIYTLGLIFHFEDGTIVGDFAEKFFYSEDAVSYDKADFIGSFVMTGKSQFSGYDDADMDVNITEGENENELVITGIDYAEEVIALFNSENSTMSIAPQVLADVVLSSGTYDATLYTTDAEGVSTTSAIDFTFNMQGDLVMTPTSVADGYLIRSEDAGGWLDGYYNLVFYPDNTKSGHVNKQSFASFNVRSSANFIIKEELDPVNNFEIQGKRNPKKMKKNNLNGFVL